MQLMSYLPSHNYKRDLKLYWIKQTAKDDKSRVKDLNNIIDYLVSKRLLRTENRLVKIDKKKEEMHLSVWLPKAVSEYLKK